MGHGAVGRQYAGKVKQLITGSTGLDDAEWGVTLFAHDTFQIKAIVYQMRFDPVSAVYADFGEFYIGAATAARRIVPAPFNFDLRARGWVAEWSNAHAWKACLPKGNQGSNPCPSAGCLIFPRAR